MLTWLVTLLLMVALGWGAFRIGQLLLGPLWSSLRWVAASRPIPLPVPSRRLLTRSPSDLADHSLTRPAISERTYLVSRDGFTLKVKTSGHFVDADGRPVGFPWSPEDRREAQAVVSSTVILSLEDRALTFAGTHVELGPQLRVVGDEALGWAVLDDATLDALSPADRLVIADHRISLWSPFALERGALDRALDVAVRIGRRILQASYKDGRIDLPGLYAENYRTAHRSETKVRALAQLLGGWPEHPESRAIAAEAQTGDDRQLRYRVALALKESGHQALLSLVADPLATPSVRAAAARSLLAAGAPAMVEALLSTTLAGLPEEVLLVLIPRLADRRAEADAPRLLELLPSASPELGAELAQGLARIGSAQAEPALLRLLGDEDPNLRIAAADGLAMVGTRSSLPALVVAARSRLQADLQIAASTAVELIRQRIGEGTRGALALSDDLPASAGALALDPQPQGAVSPLPDKTRKGTGDDHGRGG